jgi:uncharacterized Fe-S cluster-containing protein
MADYDCDYCSKESSCRYAYDEINCRETEIQECKVIANDKFTEFYRYLKEMNKVMCNDSVRSIVDHMSDIIISSEQDI